MNTLFVFLIRRDQVAQLVAYVLMGLLMIALEVGFAGAPRLPAPADAFAASAPVRTADAASVR
jgi:hypothetical protein